MNKAEIKEKAKDLCSDTSNILIHHYKGNTTEFAEAKAVEDAEEIINTINREIVEKACDAYCKVCGHFPHTVPTHICRQDCEYYTNFKQAMEE